MSPARILVVDDNPVNLKLVILTLEYAGFAVFAAQDAEAARNWLAGAEPPDLIILDVSLPGMDGLTLTRKLKADPATTDIPIIILTASAMRGDEEAAYTAGANGYITKPIDVGRFPGQLAGFLRHR
jgi:CheY-like chemotaxis protein